MTDQVSSPPAPPHLLPEDVNSPQFIEGLQLLRGNYADRTSFNHFVCDELARRAIPPNSANVLKYGRWGQSVAVAADVRSWFAHVSRRLSARHANIPDVCQQQFNALGEQFWALALDHAQKPLQEELARVQDACAREVSQLQGRLDATITARDVAEQQLHTQIKALEDQAEALDERLQKASGALEQGKVDLSLMQERALAAERALEQARQDFEVRVGALQAAAQADKSAREQAHKEAVDLLQAANVKLDAQFEAARREAATQIDKARQDARAAEDRSKEAQARADSARAETESVREQLVKMTVAQARSARDQEALQAQLEKSQADAAAAIAQERADAMERAERSAQQAERALNLAREDALLELAQSAAQAGIELKVSNGAKRPDWMAERAWKSFVALLTSSRP